MALYGKYCCFYFSLNQNAAGITCVYMPVYCFYNISLAIIYYRNLNAQAHIQIFLWSHFQFQVDCYSLFKPNRLRGYINCIFSWQRGYVNANRGGGGGSPSDYGLNTLENLKEDNRELKKRWRFHHGQIIHICCMLRV